MDNPELEALLEQMQFEFQWDEPGRWWRLIGNTHLMHVIWSSSFFSAANLAQAEEAAIRYIQAAFLDITPRDYSTDR